MGLSDAHIESLSKGGIHNAQDVAFAVFTDWIDSVPGIDEPADLAEIRSKLDAFRAKLPDAQLWDFEAFVAEHAPADEKPVKTSRKRKEKTAASS